MSDYIPKSKRSEEPHEERQIGNVQAISFYPDEKRAVLHVPGILDIAPVTQVICYKAVTLRESTAPPCFDAYIEKDWVSVYLLFAEPVTVVYKEKVLTIKP